MLKAPWTKEQIEKLNKWQQSGMVHPYTCGGKKDGKDCREVLAATENGWICPANCGYTQNWAHDMMLSDLTDLFDG
jgi:hypothetical protein